MSKIGLVVEGGGMKCAYSAGILDAFLDEHISFDYCIGVSAGSANVLSYLAGQRGRNRRFYVEHIGEPMYFGLRSLLKTGNLFNLEYIYGALSNSDGADPLDMEAILKNPAEYELVATDAVTGEAAFFSKHDLRQDDYRHVMASSAIPAVCRPVEIDGHYYYDGGISCSIPVKRALEQGCDKVVVISSKPRDYIKNPEKFKWLYSLVCRKYPKAVQDMNTRHIMYRECQKLMFELETQGRGFIFAPSQALKMSTYAMDKEANQQLYDLGLRDFSESREKLLAFMQD